MTTRRRSNGEGSVYPDKERGGWIGLVLLDGKRRKVRAKTKTDVLAKMAQLRTDSVTQGVVADGNMTVGELLDRWHDRELASRELAPSTRVRYRWCVDLLRAELGTTRVRRLNVDMVEKALDRIGAGQRGKPLSRASLVKVRDTLVQALDFAVRRNLAVNNPARLSIISPDAIPAKRRTALEADDAARLWEAVEGHRLAALVRVMLCTGLRPGEALGLTWAAVNLDRGELTVRRAVRLERGRAVIVDQLKTTASFRTIALPAVAVDELRRQRRVVAEMTLAANAWRDENLVFPTTNGGPWNPANMRTELLELCETAGLPPIRPNELRHSFASLLSARGVGLERIADQLGHTSTRMLDLTYRHRTRDAIDASVVEMTRLFGS